MSTERAVPILPARDLAETRAFYERLGFETAGWWPKEFGGYAILMRGELELQFFGFPGLRSEESNAGCYLRVADVDALHAEFLPLGLPVQGIPRLNPVQDKPWGGREFELVDPNGTLVRVGLPWD